MKKVGIITLFHGSLNFGGVLQACALCKALDQLGIPNEQIRCVFEEEEEEKRTLAGTLKKLVNPKVVWNRIKYELNGMKSEQQKSGRREAFAGFNARHVHSTERVYTTANVHECLGNYGAFITGSDQVWNPEWYSRTLFLDFVPSHMTKIAYAASLGKSALTEKQQEKFRAHLKDYRAVSVRESDAVDIVAPLSPVPVESVLDPTLLLEKEQWHDVCADRLVEEEYLFYYFLGKDGPEAALAEEYARKTGLKIAGIPNSARDFSKKETITYDHEVMDASPAEFLSLIRHAKVVLTDSFHATVFSNVFEKEYFAFPRAGHDGMNSRILRVASLHDTLERFCDTPEKRTVGHMESAVPVDWSRPLPELQRERQASLDFLRKNLGE